MKKILLLLFLFQSFLNERIRDTYPKKKDIKGIQPDLQDPNQMIGNKVSTVAFNFPWFEWQPTRKSSCTSSEFQYDGFCYKINQFALNQIRTYTNAGLTITGILYGVPEYARESCPNQNKVFCSPTFKGSIEFGRYAGALAYFFNGENGNGRVADFVIHNEVNAAEWFNIGCNSNNCNIDKWVKRYSRSYNYAYDYIVKEQKNARVLISFEHHFGKEFDKLIKSRSPVISVETFLSKLVPMLGNRKWRLAFHSYPKNLLKPIISPNDYPQITFGNIGVLAGYLRRMYPKNPHAWEIQLTENGLNGVNSEMQKLQNKNLCQSFINILGTPGIESFIYHRLKDHPDETRQGLSLGLWTHDNKYKPAWSTFCYANNKNGDGPKCGFETLPYVKLLRGYNSQYHWVTTRQMPDGFKVENSWKILREKEKDTILVYECRVGGVNGKHTMISKDVNCEGNGNFNMGPMGYVYKNQVNGSVPIYRCSIKGLYDHFISGDSGCEGYRQDKFIGYVKS